MRVPVFVASWQIECCAEPPAVGARVEWKLGTAGKFETGTASYRDVRRSPKAFRFLDRATSPNHVAGCGEAGVLVDLVAD